MTGQAFRKLALALAGAHEEPHFERSSFRVGKKIFATLTADGAEAMVKVQPIDRVEALLAGQPEVFFSFGGWTERHGSVGVRLARVHPELLAELLTLSWSAIAPRGTAAARSARASTAAKPTPAPAAAKRAGVGPSAPKDTVELDSAAAFRRWLEKHHARATELWVAFRTRASGRQTLSYSDALDEALCFGWIDGVRRGAGEGRYVIRFTPRKPKSYWSAVNLRRAAALAEAGRMHPAGAAAFEARDRGPPRRYSFEAKPAAFAPARAQRLRARPDACDFFEAQTPSYRKTATFWVESAKQEETRERRFATLVACSAAGAYIPPLRWTKTPPRKAAR